MHPIPEDLRDQGESLQPDYELDHPWFAIICGGFLLTVAIGAIVMGVVTGGLW